MKNKFRYLLILSSIFFWISFISLSSHLFVLFTVFGICAGFLIAKNRPLSELNWPKRAVKCVLWLIAAALTAIVCICCARFFHVTWSSNTLFQSFLTRFVPDFNTGLLGIEIILAIGMFPSVFDLLCRGLCHAWGLINSIPWASLWKYAAKTVTGRAFFKDALLVVVTLFLGVSIGLGLLTAVYCIPIASVEKNVTRSAQTMQNEGTYPVVSKWFHSTLDNWTDAIILMETSTIQGANALEGAINASHGFINSTNSPTESFIAHYTEGQPYDTIVEYCRYWHGYLVLVKPLLCLMDYNGMRILNGAMQLILMTVICLLLAKKGYREYVIPFLLMYLMLMPVALAASLQFSTCFYVIALAVILLLLTRQEKLNCFAAPLFLLIGIATAYVDFLTYPIATFGIPMLILLLLRNSSPLEDKFFQIVKCGIFWCMGFAGMWASKWILSHVICGYSYSNIINIIADRTAMDVGIQNDWFYIETLNYFTFLSTPVSFLLLLFIGNRYRKIRRGGNVASAEAYRIVAPYILTSCAPIVWYTFASNHSFNHFWFTNKACAVTLLGVLFAVTAIHSLQKQSSDHK